MKKFLIVAGLIIFLIAIKASADIGPKPDLLQTDFYFDFKIPYQIIVKGGYLIQCIDITCLESRIVKDTSPTIKSFENFNCNQLGCFSRTYGYRQYQKLVIQFSDKTRESNIFLSLSGLNFSVEVNDNDLKVIEPMDSSGNLINDIPIPSYIKYFIIAFVITLLVEVLVGWWFLKRNNLSLKVIYSIILVNIFSVPLLWYGMFITMQILGWPYYLLLAMLEIVVVLLEALVIYFLNWRLLNLKMALWLCIFMNVGSLLLGNLIIILFRIS